jgi:hypothetical protein
MCRDRTILRAYIRRLLIAPARLRFEVRSVWNLYWSKWRWGGFSSSTSVSYVNFHSTDFSIIISYAVIWLFVVSMLTVTNFISHCVVRRKFTFLPPSSGSKCAKQNFKPLQRVDVLLSSRATSVSEISDLHHQSRCGGPPYVFLYLYRFLKSMPLLLVHYLVGGWSKTVRLPIRL